MKSVNQLKMQMFRLAVVLSVFVLGFHSVIKADPVDVEKAEVVALTQLQRVSGNVSLRSAASPDLVYEPKNEVDQPYFYVFNGSKGFVIVSGDDRAIPILGYSDDGYFDPNDISPEKVWCKLYSTQSNVSSYAFMYNQARKAIMHVYSGNIPHKIVYVTPEGAGNKDGSSWENATPDLYGEMQKDRTDTMQIWVKAGVYYGDTTVGQGADKAAFILGKRNKVYGGFAGNESSLATRACVNPSILDGQHARRVVCQLTDFAAADSSFIDGFILRNGLDTIAGTANIEMIAGGQSSHNGGTDMTGNGGGAYLRKNGILKNCIVVNCKAISGGGIFNYGGKVIDCSFIDNEAEHAGGLFNRGITSLANSNISNNKTIYQIGYGGGIYNMGDLNIFDGTLINNNKGIIGNGLYTHFSGVTIMNGGEISDNIVEQIGIGGGIYNDGVVIIYNGNIINNQAGGGGGIASHGTLTLYGGNVSDNISTSYGGGIYNGGTLNMLSASVNISGNLASSYGGGIASVGGELNINAGTIGVMTDSAPESVEGALAMGGNVALGYNGGGGIYCEENKSVSFIDNGVGSVVIGGNYANSDGGGIYSRDTYIIPSNVYICGNVSNSSGGGIYTSRNITLSGCNISHNKAYYNGGGIYNSSYLYLFGGKMSDNKALMSGGAIWNTGTFNAYGGEISGNTANLGSGIYNNSSSYLTDSIVIKDIIYSYYAVSLGHLTYHTDNTKPITMDGRLGYYYPVVNSSLSQYYVDQGIIVGIAGLYPAIYNSNYVYLYSNGTRSMEQHSATDNEDIGQKAISVYPTLVTSGGTLTIESPDGGNASVWNLSGTMVGQYKLEYGRTQLPISYPAGNYIIKVQTDTGHGKTVKIIVK